MVAYNKIALKKVGSSSPITGYFSIIIFLSLLLAFPGQAFSTVFGLVTDPGLVPTLPGVVVVVDLDNNTVEGTIPVGVMPEGIVLGDNSFAYVANKGSNTVSAIDISTPDTSTVITIPVSIAPQFLDVTPDGRFVLVTQSDPFNYGIDVIDTSTKTVVTTIRNPFDTSSPPGDIVIDGNFAYVTYPGDHLVGILDISGIPASYIEDWSVLTSPDLPEMIVATFSPDYIYVTTDNGFNDTVIQINSRDSQAIPIPYDYLNFNGPNHLAMHMNGQDLYVTNELGNSVTVIDTSMPPQGPSAFTIIDVGISPSGIAFSPDGSLTYITNSGDGTISIIDTANKTSVGSTPRLLTAPVDITIIERINAPPFEPFNPTPPDGGSGVSVSTILSWEGGDPDSGDSVIYNVFKGTDPNQPLDQICADVNHPDTFCIPPLLEYDTTFYWMVRATDSSGNISGVPFPYWSFTTEVSAPSCAVFITPGSPTVGFGDTLQFSASTVCDGISVAGEYFWDLTSSIGSIIDGNGLYTAGTTEGTDLVTVTDTANGDSTGSAPVMVTASGSPCLITVDPTAATVSSGDTLTFNATTTPIPPNTGCAASTYLWEITTPIGSAITQAGVYTAGLNDTGSDRLDVITVTDTANGDIVTVADVTVLAEAQGAYTVEITPAEMTLVSLGNLQFTAQTFLVGDPAPLPEADNSYHWEISPPSIIGSFIDASGLYTAGINYTGNLLTETVLVSDTAHSDASATAAVTVLVRASSNPYLILPPGGPLLQISYRMFSVGPLWPVNGDALHVTTGATEYDDFFIRLFRGWDDQLVDPITGNLGGWSEYPAIPELEPGMGAWVIESVPLAILTGGVITVDGTLVDTSVPFPITLQSGWTQIANPFPKTVDWNQVSVMAPGGDMKYMPLQTEVETPWAYTGVYLPATLLQPWNGYLVYNNSAGSVTISIPPETGVAAQKAPAPLPEPDVGVKLQIGAQNIPFFWLQDTYNYIGLSENSTSERDSKDLHEPPAISSGQPSLYFLHDEWEGKMPRFTTDFRSLDSREEVFECTVNPGSGFVNLLRLFWPDMTTVPPEYRMEFTDPETGITLDMKEVGDYWFLSYFGLEKTFTITMKHIK
jgi:YVTN family beta-propeller protein